MRAAPRPHIKGNSVPDKWRNKNYFREKTHSSAHLSNIFMREALVWLSKWPARLKKTPLPPKNRVKSHSKF